MTEFFHGSPFALETVCMHYHRNIPTYGRYSENKREFPTGNTSVLVKCIREGNQIIESGHIDNIILKRVALSRRI